jgi:hypothetical protein
MGAHTQLADRQGAHHQPDLTVGERWPPTLQAEHEASWTVATSPAVGRACWVVGSVNLASRYRATSRIVQCTTRRVWPTAPISQVVTGPEPS